MPQQPTLFDSPTFSQVYQSGRTLRDQGIEKAVINADKQSENWSSKCYALFLQYLKATANPFQMEQFREWVKFKIDSPPHLRAYGFVSVKAVREGLIKKVGCGPVKNKKAHCANSNIWKRI